MRRNWCFQAVNGKRRVSDERPTQELEKESDNRIIRFEQVISQPLEFSCRCSFNNRVSEDIKGEMVYKELANRLLSEFKKNPDLLSLKTTEDFLEDNQIIEARVRLLPYIRRQTA